MQPTTFDIVHINVCHHGAAAYQRGCEEEFDNHLQKTGPETLTLHLGNKVFQHVSALSRIPKSIHETHNFAELICTIDSLQLTATHKVATPADWQHGDDVIIVPSVSDDEAWTLFPDGWQTVKPYLRKVTDPSKP